MSTTKAGLEIDAGIAVLRFDNPPVNSLGLELRKYIVDGIDRANADPAVQAIVLIGSGAGFPGIPMAILRPDCRFTLAESHQRKAVFLREATRHLSSIRVVACRAEEIEGSFEWLVSRAVKWPEVLKIAVPAAAVRRFRTVALLMGQEDAADVVVQPNFAWREPIPLPWGHRRVLVLGQTASSGD